MAKTKKVEMANTSIVHLSTLSPEDLITTEEVANLLSVSIQSVRKWVEKNKIPFFRITRKKILFSKEALTIWLNEKAVQPLM